VFLQIVFGALPEELLQAETFMQTAAKRRRFLKVEASEPSQSGLEGDLYLYTTNLFLHTQTYVHPSDKIRSEPI
jgi:hypothetical protein